MDLRLLDLFIAGTVEAGSEDRGIYRSLNLNIA